MISSVSFIPKGAADPRPKRYMLSSGEANMLSKLAGDGEGVSAPEEGDGEKEGKKSSSVELEEVDISTLPADLRMDEYDDDDANVGELLVGTGGEMVGTHLGPDGIPQEQIDEEDEDQEEGDDNDSNGDDDDDDDDEVSLSDDEYDPMHSDDREYVPTDTAALAAMNIGFKSGGGQLYFDDEKNLVGGEGGEQQEEYDSDEEDTNLRPTDVLALCATTDTNDDFSTLEVYVYEVR